MSKTAARADSKRRLFICGKSSPIIATSNKLLETHLFQFMARHFDAGSLLAARKWLTNVPNAPQLQCSVFADAGEAVIAG